MCVCVCVGGGGGGASPHLHPCHKTTLNTLIQFELVNKNNINFFAQKFLNFQDGQICYSSSMHVYVQHSCQPSRSARESPADQALSRIPPDREIL